MKHSKTLLRTLYILLAAMFMATSAAAAPSDSSPETKDLLETFGCENVGGTAIPQPAGSSITACCLEDGCYICDSSGGNCEFDPAYHGTGDGKPTAGHRKPVLKTGTMIMQPDTNTTVGTGAKPLGGKLIMRNMIRK